MNHGDLAEMELYLSQTVIPDDINDQDVEARITVALQGTNFGPVRNRSDALRLYLYLRPRVNIYI